MTTGDDALDAISGWTDDELGDDVRAAGVLYAAAALEELTLIELVERLNELNQNKMLSIGAGEASNLLHEFWDKGYKRMPAKRRAALYVRVFGTPVSDAPADLQPNTQFAELFERLIAALADGPGGAVGPAAAELQANLAEHTDETTTKAAVELRGTFAELGPALSDMELLSAYHAADMWQLVANVLEGWGGAADVPSARARATAGATILRHLPELAAGDEAGDGPAVAAAKQWLPSNFPAA